ncbi:MAG: hypothetical protein AAGA23_01785 [Pseudomonadota bacterium]
MTEFKSRWWGLALVLASVPLYLLGMARGALVVLILAALVELTGWVKLLINPFRKT